MVLVMSVSHSAIAIIIAAATTTSAIKIAVWSALEFCSFLMAGFPSGAADLCFPEYCADG